MTAVLKYELRNYFNSLTAYLFGAFLLVFVGIGSMLYNIQAAVSNFEFVLAFSSMVFIVLVPVLTMKVIAEERKQKTDQLLYSLPISTTEVVIGKYIALLAVFALPLCIIALYPLIFSLYGDVYLPTSYGSLAAFFLTGCALVALGMFISSLTDNQGFAAGMSIAAIVFNYYSVSLAEYVSATALGSAVAVMLLAALAALVIRKLTKNDNLAFGTMIAVMALVAISMFIDPTLLEGLLPELMRSICVFDRLDIFVNGVFDLTSVVFFLSMAALFLFLTVQSLEKRRYN